jgi:choice-of-anchor B domain-containing protein
MRKIFTLFLISFSCKAFCQYASQNVTFLGRFDEPTVPSEPFYGLRYNGVWGYADTVNNKEYGIIGSTNGTFIVDVTNPANCTQVAFFPGRRDSCIWREYKTYKNYLYAVSDDGGQNSLQIIDLSTSPSPTLIFDSDSIFRQSHTIFIDGDKLYGGRVTTRMGFGYSMAVYSLADPKKPQFLRGLNEDYPSIGTVHDMFVRNDTIFASCGYSKSLNVFKLESSNTFTQIGSLTVYPEQGYNHSSAWTKNGKTLVMCDEVPAGLKVKILDVSDLSDIKVVSTFESSTAATPHNPFLFNDNRLIMAYYTDGVQIYDISDPSQPVRTGYFDTYPDPLTENYAGCWGAYVHLPSGNILASDMQRGLFVLDADAALSISEQRADSRYSVFPNPFNDKVTISSKGLENETAEVSVHDLAGKEILREQVRFAGRNISILMPSALEKGIYMLTLSASDGRKTFKLIK